MNGATAYTGARVGFVLFVALAILVAGLYAIAFRPTVVGDMAYFKTFFSETGGLRTGAPVWIGGVEVGSVSDIAFTGEELRAEGAREIEVTLAVGRRFSGRVRADSICRIRTRGLLGEKIVTIRPGSSAEDAIEPGGTIGSEEGQELEQAIATAGAGVDRTAAAAVMALDELRQILVDIRTQQGILHKLIYSDEFYRDTIDRVDAIVQEVRMELAELTATLKAEIGRVREDASRTIATLEDEVAATGHEFRASSEKFREELGEFGSLVKDIREGKGSAAMIIGDESLAGALRQGVDNLGEALLRFASIAARIDAGEGTLGKLVNDPSAYTSMRDLFEGVQESWLLRGAVRQAEEDGRALRIERWAEAKEPKGRAERPEGKEEQRAQ